MVSLPDDVETALLRLAHREGVPPATKAVYLIKLAIELDEDAVWDKIASERDQKNTKFLSHEDLETASFVSKK